MSAIEYFIIGINKTVVFVFHSILLTLHMFASCSHFNSSPSVTSLVWTLSPYFFSPSHDCQFSKCLPCQKMKVLESFVNSCIFFIRRKEIWQEILFPLLSLLLLLSHFSRVRLCATPAAHHAPPSLGFSRQEHWSGLPFPSPMHESEK